MAERPGPVKRWLEALGLDRTGWQRLRGEQPDPEGDPARIAQVEAVLEELRPAFRADGGDVVLSAVDEDGWVVVRAHGACRSCHLQDATIHGALEPMLRGRLAWVRGVRVG